MTIAVRFRKGGFPKIRVPGFPPKLELSAARPRAESSSPRDISAAGSFSSFYPCVLSLLHIVRHQSAFRGWSWSWVWLPLLFVFGGNLPARAHDPFSSSATAILKPDRVELTVTLAQSAARDLLDRPANIPDEAITDENFGRFHERLKQSALKLFRITAGGGFVTPSNAEAEFTAENDIEFRIDYPPVAKGPVRFQAVYLTRMQDGHVGTLYVENSARQDLGWGYLETTAPTLEILLPVNAGNGVNADSSQAPPHRPTAPPFRAFVKLGIEHIFTGYDHLLFLAGLLIGCRRFKTMAGIITCFTVAHSLTLALAAFDVVVVPAKIVEPLIAASIVFVGVENLLRRGEEPKGRWALTFVFGLVHGFGFAGALREIGLGSGGASLLAPLFSFNLGVEIGQIAIAAIFLPLLFQLRRSPKFVRYGLPAASSFVALLGAYWLLERTLLSS